MGTRNERGFLSTSLDPFAFANWAKPGTKLQLKIIVWQSVQSNFGLHATFTSSPIFWCNKNWLAFHALILVTHSSGAPKLVSWWGLSRTHLVQQKLVSWWGLSRTHLMHQNWFRDEACHALIWCTKKLVSQWGLSRTHPDIVRFVKVVRDGPEISCVCVTFSWCEATTSTLIGDILS